MADITQNAFVWRKALPTFWTLIKRGFDVISPQFKDASRQFFGISFAELDYLPDGIKVVGFFKILEDIIRVSGRLFENILFYHNKIERIQVFKKIRFSNGLGFRSVGVNSPIWFLFDDGYSFFETIENWVVAIA